MSDDRNPLDNPDTTRALKVFEFKRVGEISLTPPDYLIDPLIERDSLVVLFGAPKSGKSLIALDMGLSLSTTDDANTGLDVEWDIGEWYGLKSPTGSSPVIYVCGEGWRGIKRREMAWRKGHPSRGEALFYVSQTAANLTDLGGAQAVIEGIESVIGIESPVLIIIDTLARNFGGQDENSTQAMNLFVANLDLIRSTFKGATVLVVHHTGHGNGDRGRGSSVLRGALDTEIKVEKLGEVVTMSVVSQKDGEPTPPKHFRLKRETIATDSQGLAVTSVRLDEDKDHTVEPIGMGDNQRAVWNAVLAEMKQKQNNGLDQVITKAEIRSLVNELEARSIREAIKGLEQRNRLKVEGENVRLA